MFTLPNSKEDAMGEMGQGSKFLGYVQLQIGSMIVALPVEAVRFDRDRDGKAPGGFFAEESGRCGIIVDGDASASDVQVQIARASADAVRHISKKFLN